MTDFPEKINISPVHRQKRDDDFYLVDRAAFPGKGTEYLRADVADAEKRELALQILATDGQAQEALARAEAAEAKLVEAVEALETTAGYLEGVIEDGCPKCGGDCSAANPPVTFCPMKETAGDLAKARATIAKIKGGRGMTKKMWAVGDDDGEGWIAVSAETELDARKAYSVERHGADVSVPDHIIAVRVKSWDALESAPTGRDWLEAGLSYRCEAGCGGMACLDGDGKIIDGKPYCEECAEATQ